MKFIILFCWYNEVVLKFVIIFEIFSDYVIH